jgi:hypothetical protein
LTLKNIIIVFTNSTNERNVVCNLVILSRTIIWNTKLWYVFVAFKRVTTDATSGAEITYPF